MIKGFWVQFLQKSKLELKLNMTVVRENPVLPLGHQPFSQSLEAKVIVFVANGLEFQQPSLRRKSTLGHKNLLVCGPLKGLRVTVATV